MERNPRYHEVIPPEVKARVARAVGSFLFGTANINPNERPSPTMSQAEIDAIFANQYDHDFEAPGE